ncbi:preprotein translocase subunit YajC [Kineococcus sp. GCM10028916]|uniref:preprotein translocase subunit YajC n=1 Tax=Kineococcus sp. GCM10028916 TaxID=3273394 RepID=UPI003627317B
MGGGNSQLIFLLIMVALLVFMFSRTRKQQKAQQQMQTGVAPGARVMTTSGMFGTVVDIEGDEVVLEIAPGLQTRWTRRAVARVVAPTEVAPLEESADPVDGGLSLQKRDDDAAGGATRAQ